MLVNNSEILLYKQYIRNITNYYQCGRLWVAECPKEGLEMRNKIIELNIPRGFTTFIGDRFKNE